MPKGKGKKKTKKLSSKKPDESTSTETEPTEDENPTTLEPPLEPPPEPEGAPDTPESEPKTEMLGGDPLKTPCPPLQEPAPIPENSPEPRLPKIAFRVFEKIAGPKWDQLAGFKQYARANNLGPMTVPEWREALQAFRDKPTKSR